MTAGKAIRPLWPGDDWTAVSPLGWTGGRDAKLPAKEPFHKRWEKRNRAADVPPPTNRAGSVPESGTHPARFEQTGTLAARFGEKLAALDGTLHETDDPKAKVHELLGKGTVAAHPLPLLIDAVEAPPDAADFSVIHADVAIADTGQVAWSHNAERGRREALLPDRQIVLLRRSDLVASVAEALARWFGANDPPTNVVFAAGPSRTADIEQTMMLGVHAPRSLDVVLYG
jgi:hypothetical protein